MNSKLSRIVALGLALLPASGLPAGAQTGWHGETTGARQGSISGPGKFACQDSLQMTPSSRAPATLVLSDGARTGTFRISFSLPRNIGLGKHALAASTVFDLGRVIQIRVDTNGNMIDFFDKNPVGYLTVEALPDGSAASAGKEVRGQYGVHVENLKGESINVKGAFQFVAPEEVSGDPSKQWFCTDPLQ